MSVNVLLLLVMGVLVSTGIYLLLERSLTRVLLGIVLLGNGVNLLLLTVAGRPGRPPLIGETSVPAQEYSDPLPQALILTAIVITFAVTAFMLGIIYRSWWLSRQDEVEDDLEDRRVAEAGLFDPEEDSELPTETTEFATAEEVEADDDGGLGEDPTCSTPAEATRKRLDGRRAQEAHATALVAAAEALHTGELSVTKQRETGAAQPPGDPAVGHQEGQEQQRQPGEEGS